ncbi:MAG: hypothetical protein J1F64_02290, partial [Oscillospiraceae bacterium]|nr:hypothetical protein [Oscillospiraceae bacterium]
MISVKRLTAGIIAALMMITLMPVISFAEDPAEFAYAAGGSGTEDDPYLIETAEQLAALAAAVNGDGENTGNNYAGTYFNLTADIDLGCNRENQWTPIGNYNYYLINSDDKPQFKGIFDGCGHKISGIYIKSSGYAQGLFGYLGRNGEIKNLIVDGSVSGGYYVGGIVGMKYGTVENCGNMGIISGDGGIGGVVGWNYRSGVNNCYNLGKVSGGGVVGNNDSGTVSNCYNLGKVSGESVVGGVVESNYRYSAVKNCYNIGSVSGGKKSAGGVVGSNTGNVTSCYNIGKVSGESEIGGIVGTGAGTVTGCYYLEGTADGSDADGSAEKKSAAEFKDASNFTDWDFAGIWKIDPASGRPVLISNPEQPSIPDKEKPNDDFDEVITDVPHEIYDIETLNTFRKYINSGNSGEGEYFKLTADIDLGCDKNNQWKPIGNKNNHFKGTFDGCGHKISGIYIDDYYIDYQGLFGYVGENGIILNLGTDGSVIAGSHVGGIAGFNCGNITNCYNTCFVSGDDYVGGIAGEMIIGTVSQCYNTGNIFGFTEVGGIVGYLPYNNENSGSVKNCFNTGNISGSSDYSCVGGIVATNWGSVENCYSIGSVSGRNCAGIALNDKTGRMSRCYYLGGMIDKVIEYWDAIEITKEEFTDVNTFKDKYGSWDFDTIWIMDKYLNRPVLR